MIGKTWHEAWEHVIPFLAFPADVTPRRLHHQHDRSAAPPDPQDDQDPRPLPDRRRRPQADLPLDHQRPEELEDRLQLERRPAFIQNPLRRPTALTHRKSDTLPGHHWSAWRHRRARRPGSGHHRSARCSCASEASAIAISASTRDGPGAGGCRGTAFRRLPQQPALLHARPASSRSRATSAPSETTPRPPEPDGR